MEEGRYKKKEHFYLGKPVFSLTLVDFDIKIYKAKDYKSTKWFNDHLHDLVRLTRRSYLIYGDVPLDDEYDSKSSIYLAQGIFKSNGVVVRSDYISMRFVSAEGVPFFSEDLNHCTIAGEPVTEVIRRQLFENKPSFSKKIVTLSRLAAYTEYASGKKNKLIKKNIKWTALYVALISKVFQDESRSKGENIEYITAMFRPELLQKVLTISIDLLPVSLVFQPAHHTLSVPASHVSVGRTDVSYKYPGYFLNCIDLLILLRDLIDSGKITRDTFIHFYGSDHLYTLIQKSKNMIINKEMIIQFKDLGLMLSYEGKYPAGSISGSDLRKLIDANVGDGTILTITAYADYKKSTEDFLWAFKQSYMLTQSNLINKKEYAQFIPQAVGL